MGKEKNHEDKLQLTLNKDDFRYLPLREAVYAVIKKAILENQLQPGQRLVEEKLAETLGVSRTPLREALRKLENERFITVYGSRYAEIATIKREELLEEYALREVIEGFATRLASKHRTLENISTMRFHIDKMQVGLDQNDVQAIISANSDFHMAMIDASHNSKIKEVMETLWKSMRMFSTTSLRNQKWASQAIKEHKEILMAIEASDAELAVRLVQEHIKNSMLILPKI